MEQVGVELAPFIVEERRLGERLADPHQHPAVDLAVCADLVDDHSRIVRRCDLEHPYDASLPIEADPGRLRDELGSEKRL